MEGESWWTSTASTYESISIIGDVLTTCYSMLESLWSVRSEGLCFLNENKLCHSLSICKIFQILAILSEAQQNRGDLEWWFTMNLISLLLFALMFIFLSNIIARLRLSNRLRSRMAKYLPTSWKPKSLVSIKEIQEKSESGNNPLPYPQMHPYHSYYQQLSKKNRHKATASYLGSSNNIQIGQKE